MNILIVTQYYWPENFRVNELSYELKKSGNNVTILTGYPNYPSRKIFSEFYQNSQKYNIYKGIKVIRVPVIPRGKNKLQLLINYFSFAINASTIGILKILNQKFDIVFTFQTSPILVGIPSLLIASVKKSSHILWILDLWPETLSAIGFTKNKFLLETIRYMVEFIYSKCNIILVQSKSFIKKIKNYHNKKIIYFPAWAESEINKSSKSLAKEIIEKEGIFSVLFAGNIGKAQDFPSIVKAAEYLIKNDFHKFRIITVGEGSCKDWLINEVNKKHLNDFFEICDSFPIDRMASFFSHADALLVSLKNEEAFNMTIPGKIQTYLSTGIPLLGMLSGEGAKVITDSNSGFVCPGGDFLGLANLIMKMSYLEKKDREILGKNGIEYCQNEFNKKVLIKRLEAIMIKLKSNNKTIDK